LPDARTILFAGGGSGGHLYPGVAVAQSLARRYPDITPLFLCTQRDIDRTILDQTPFAYQTQPIVPPRRSIGGLLRFWRAWRATQDLVRSIVKTRQPVAVLGLGGYAAGVAVKCASKAKVPTAILNPDVIPGKANQFLLAHVRQVFCQFEQTRAHIAEAHQGKLITVGCPIRADITARPPRDEAVGRLGLDPLLQTLVVTGASQGAVTVNQAVLESLSRMADPNSGRRLQGWQVLHLSGKENADDVRKEYRDLEVPARVVDFTPNMADVWAVADLAVSRAGASSCAELVACGVPSVLMPYPFHKDKHQLANAQALADTGAAVVVEDHKDRKKNADALRPVLESLLYDVPRRQSMRDAAGRLGQHNAADAVADALVAMIAAKP
jgi:UDP-N-acetylglucosamine--N-acetylmuramyl-(pentapeptide) pyrophosphoryl-undecaprenol N-acetylglucosamine transferase